MSTTISGTNGVTFPDSTSMQTGQQACKAWVNFNGTGTVAIRGSYNVSSITDNGTGMYAINFTTAMPDVNYAITGAVGAATSVSGSWFTSGMSGAGYLTNNTVNSCRVQVYYTTSNIVDTDFVYAAIFR